MAAHRVLVIEDDEGSRTALHNLLIEEGYVVRAAGSGRAGLEAIADFAPDTIVCDYRLPDISGLEVLREVRASGRPVTFIVMTADCGGAEMERALRHEADFFVRKPLDFRYFHTLLQGGRLPPPSTRQPMTSMKGKERTNGRL